MRPSLILMFFIRAEQESDWPLYLWAVSRMVPYIFESAQVNYARYGMLYLTSVESFPTEVQ